MSCGNNLPDGSHGFMHEVPGVYQYNKRLMLGVFPASYLDQVQEVEFAVDDVILAGYPRSGIS